jgi:hypothetical protein
MVFTTIAYLVLAEHPPVYPPRTAPRPTDQCSGELKNPALTAFLGIPNDDTDIDFAPVPPDPAPSTCPHCQRPVRDEDTALASPLTTDHGLPPHLCLNCTLEELELLAPYTEAEDGMPVVFASLLAA